MAKRRTKKQKSTAKHRFTLSWNDKSAAEGSVPKKPLATPTVKGQTKKRGITLASPGSNLNKAKDTAYYLGLASIKRDLIKSVALASLILSLEVVLYLTR